MNATVRTTPQSVPAKHGDDVLPHGSETAEQRFSLQQTFPLAN